MTKYWKAIWTPTSTGIQKAFNSKSIEQKQFWFYPTKLESYIKGAYSQYILYYLTALDKLLKKMGNNWT